MAWCSVHRCPDSVCEREHQNESLSDEAVLEKYGWIMECGSPLEISNEEYESRATGVAAEIVIHAIRKGWFDE